MQFLGIDPGVEGAFVLLTPEGMLKDFIKTPVSTYKMSTGKIKKKINGEAVIAFLTTLPKDTSICIEQVTSSPQMGVVSAFSFGFGFGNIIGALEVFGFPIQYVTPRVWKHALMQGLPPEKEASLVAVNRLRPRSYKKMFKDIKPDHNLADAFLIAEWGRKNYVHKTS